MKRISVVLLALLAACAGGGSGTSTPPTTAPITYTAQLHWQPASTVGLSSFLRSEHLPYAVTLGNTIIVGSGNGGSSAYDPTTIPAYVSVSVSPQPSPGTTAQFSTTSASVAIENTPIPPTPNPSASPAVLIAAPSPNATDSGHTVSVVIAGATASDNLIVYPTLTLVDYKPSTSSPVLPDAGGFTFNSACQAQPQTLTSAADVYITYGSPSTVTYPGGGIAIAQGYDISTLSASQWQNAGTSSTLDSFGNAVPAQDTLIFKAHSSGKIVFLAMREYGGDGPTSAAADITAIYGCLN